MNYSRKIKMIGLSLSFAAVALFSTTQKSESQVRVTLGFGLPAPVVVVPEPSCIYGYFPDPPYSCAPYGYYGPSWFGTGGIFIGAGRWYRGPGFMYNHDYTARGGFGGYYGHGYSGGGFHSGGFGYGHR